MAFWRLRYFLFWLLKRRDPRNAWAFLYSTLFTRDAGLALLDPIYRRFPSLAPYPKQIEVEVTTHCNLRCRICEHSYWNEKPRNMSYDEFLRIMEMFPDLKWIGLTGIGSGFLNPDYMRMLRFLKTEKKCFVEFFDHFAFMKEEWLHELIEIGVDKIWVSLENAKRETYNRTRIGSDFDRVLYNLKKLIDFKAAMKSPLPELWFHFIVTQENCCEMEEYIDLVNSLTEKIRRISPPLIFWTNLLGFDEVKELCIEVPFDLKERVMMKCRQKKIFSVWNENTLKKQPMKNCTKWTEPFILVSGHLQPCCAINEANVRPYQRQNAFMNVFERDFRDFWQGPEMRLFLERMQSGGINPICKYCHIFEHPEILRLHSKTTG